MPIVAQERGENLNVGDFQFHSLGRLFFLLPAITLAAADKFDIWINDFGRTESSAPGGISRKAARLRKLAFSYRIAAWLTHLETIEQANSLCQERDLLRPI